MEPPPDRGLSSVVGTVALVAIVVALAAGVLAAGTAMSATSNPPPAATLEIADTRAACHGCGPADQVVRLSHHSGDTLVLSEIELLVSVPDRRRARLVDLPLPTNCLSDDHVEGPDLFDGRCGRVGGALTAVGSVSDGTWRAGQTARFRIQKGAVRLDSGDRLTVSIVHTPSGSTVAERTVTVRSA